jgi:transposase-like protein
MAVKQFNSLFDMMEAFPDEKSAIDHLREIHWGKNDVDASCPYCGSSRVMHFSDLKTHKCGEKECRQRFSIKVGTIFENTKIPLRKWFMAIWLITSHKKGVASTTLARDIKVTQKSAWFMLHRLRHAARTNSFNAPLSGTVEVDETFIGGKDKNKHAHERKGQRGPSGKAVVWGVLKRDGEFRAYHLHSLKDDKKAVEAHVAEGAWSHIKRQIYGIHHWISDKHLGSYLAEMTWR